MFILSYKHLEKKIVLKYKYYFNFLGAFIIIFQRYILLILVLIYLEI